MSKELKCGDLSDERSRTYDVLDTEGQRISRIVILDPVSVFYGPGHAFHRVFDGESTHLCPVPGVVKDPVSLEIIGYCFVSWIAKDKNKPCQW